MLGGVWFINLFLRVFTIGVSPLLPLLIADFKLSHGIGGSLYAIPILMVALFSYPLGILSDRLGVEIMVGLGFTVAVLSSFLRSLSGTFLHLVLFTAVFGLGFALCYPNLLKLVKEHFPPRLTGTATGIYTTAMPLGAGLGISLSTPLLAIMNSWRGVFVVWSLMAAPGIFFWWLVARKSSQPQGRLSHMSPNRSSRQEVHPGHSFLDQSSKPVVICGILLSLLNVVFYCTVGWLPTYLSEQGWNSARAAAATSLVTYAELPAVFLIPVISDRVGRKKFIILISFLVTAICAAVISFRPSLTWWIAPVLGVAIGGVFALILALPVELVDRETIGRAAGAVISIGYIGALIGPPLTGYIRDLTGQFATGFLIMAFTGIVATGLSYLLPDVSRMRRH